MEQTLDYTKTQRVVLLLDLNPLLLQSPSSSSSSYISCLLSAIKPLVTFPPLSSSSLFSFKLFFSSLSPLLSSSKLPFPSPSHLSFDLPANTFQSLSRILLNPSFLPSICRNGASLPKASHLSASMRQLVHDYAWESDVNSTSIDGNCDFSSSCGIRSNLVLLFSPPVTELNMVSEFLGVGLDDGCLRDVKEFTCKFRGYFGSVNDAFVSRDIQIGWIDVKCGELSSSGVESGFWECGIRELGWGFCSSDILVLGSAVVPFVLIYPRIGLSPNAAIDTPTAKTILARLSLEIVDVNGNPLECKCCDLELAGSRSVFVDAELARCQGHNRSVLQVFGKGNAKLHVKAVEMSDNDAKFSNYLPDPILVSERMEKGGNGSRGKELFEEKVLQMLEPERLESMPNKSGPIWQILLSFLCREGYWGFVTLSDGNGCSLTGILKPFTVSSALLWIKSDEFKANIGRPSVQVITKMENGTGKRNVESDISHIGSSCGPLAPEIRGCCEDRKKNKKKRRSLSMLQELTWSDFCKAAIEHLQIDLEDIFFVRAYNKSKKLKFLKCWMKEVKKSTYQSVPISDDRLNELPHEGAQPIASSASAAEDALTGTSRVQDEVAVDYHSQSLETFLDDLPQKVQQGLECDDVDLGSLAERLVNSSVFWLFKKCENETNMEDQTREVATELMSLLLREPKDLAAKASNPSSTEVTSERIVREYELQILFRMEMLQSEIGASIKESLKQKFVKQICSCLESIQCRLTGGFFGDWSLDTYVEKILKNRYCKSLEDVVHRIYKRLDLLLFEDEDESSNPLFSSEDGNQSLNERMVTADERKGNERINNAEHSSTSWAVDSESQGSQELKQDDNDHARRLIEAQERRQRARRFASFRVPDLHKVWVPMQPKLMKVKYDHHARRQSKREERKRGRHDVVCETPTTGKDRSECSSSGGEKRNKGATTPVCGSVSKALFQDC
ncbi:hypothetical protein LINGRAHAP2_LOCUS22264 [Linum grandiflorum]